MSIDKLYLQSHINKFGTNLKLIRESKGFSQLDLAVICDYEKTTISRIENGRTNVTLKTILTLSKALEIKVGVLFDY